MTNMGKILLCGKIVDKIQADSLRPLCRLSFSPEPFGITDSHMGGVPYLPQNAAYPMGEDGQPLWLCAQINFAQVPAMEGFPAEGILQFYLSDWRYDGCFGLDSGEGGTDQAQWRVCWWPEVDETVTEADCRAKMPIPWEDASVENMGRPQNSLDTSSLKYAKQLGTPREKAIHLWRCPDGPVRLTFSAPETEGVCNTDFRFDKAFAEAAEALCPETDPEELRYYRLDSETPEEREALDQVGKRVCSGGCKLGGYPLYVQDDPRNYDEELTAWDTLLFQLDDLEAGGEGVDLSLNGGTLNFVIPMEDLKKRDFSRVLGQWACT